MSNKPIQITQLDLERLQKLIEDAQQTEYRGSDSLVHLQEELDRAEIVAPQDVSEGVVTMNSTVVLLDLETGEEETYTLVLPERADLARGRIYVLAPIGTAMLGYEAGDIFEWEVPAGTRRLKVQRVLYQPEAAGDYHL
jgi:regulator of nucleoside diphosphate kinase